MSEDWIQRFQNSEKGQYIRDLKFEEKRKGFALFNEWHYHDYTREHRMELYLTEVLKQPCVMFQRKTMRDGTNSSVEWFWLLHHPTEGLCQLSLDIEKEGILTSYFWLKGRTLPENGFSRRLMAYEFTAFPDSLEEGIKESLSSQPRYRLPLVYRDDFTISYTKQARTE